MPAQGFWASFFPSNMKTILVATSTAPRKAKLFGKSKKEIAGQKFWFAVTRLPFHDPMVTHIHTGLSVCAIGSLSIAARQGDALAAGVAALDVFISQHDEAKVAKKLAEAEKGPKL